MTRTAFPPAWSESNQNCPVPFFTRAPPTDQPAGRDATHGTAVAVGTDCAISTITDSVPHAGESAIAGSVGVNMPYTLTSANTVNRAMPTA